MFRTDCRGSDFRFEQITLNIVDKLLQMLAGFNLPCHKPSGYNPESIWRQSGNRLDTVHIQSGVNIETVRRPSGINPEAILRHSGYLPATAAPAVITGILITWLGTNMKASHQFNQI